MCLHCLECKSAIVNRICINNSTFPHLRFTFRCDLACVINLIYICCCSCCTFEFSKIHNIMCVLCLCGLSVWILGWRILVLPLSFATLSFDCDAWLKMAIVYSQTSSAYMFKYGEALPGEVLPFDSSSMATRESTRQSGCSSECSVDSQKALDKDCVEEADGFSFRMDLYSQSR